MGTSEIAFIAVALILPPTLFLVFILVAAAIAKKKIETRAKTVKSELIEASQRKMIEKGWTPEAAEAYVEKMTNQVGYRIYDLAEKRGIDLDQAMALFFKKTNTLAIWLDSKVKLPFGLSFGFDFIIGLIPVGGSILTAGAATVVVINSLQYGIPMSMVVRMGSNIAIDYVVGFVPGVGNVIDIFYRASNKNMNLLSGFLEENRRDSQSMDSHRQLGEDGAA